MMVLVFGNKKTVQIQRFILSFGGGVAPRIKPRYFSALEPLRTLAERCGTQTPAAFISCSEVESIVQFYRVPGLGFMDRLQLSR